VVVSKFLVDLVVDLVEPMVQSVPRREVDGQDLVGVGQTGPTELAGEDVGQGLEEGGVGGFLFGCVDKGGVMEEAPTGRSPEASVHGSLLGGGTFGNYNGKFLFPIWFKVMYFFIAARKWSWTICILSIVKEIGLYSGR